MGVSLKILEMESHIERSERETNQKFEEIKSDIAQVETSVTAKVIESMDPKIAALKSDITTEMKEKNEENDER